MSKYFIALFGDPNRQNKTRVESGWYPSEKGFHPNRQVAPGDVLLLYCTGRYPINKQSIVGLGDVFSSTTSDGLRYQYSPIKPPISRAAVKDALAEEERQRFNLLYRSSNWLIEITEPSFRAILRLA